MALSVGSLGAGLGFSGGSSSGFENTNTTAQGSSLGTSTPTYLPSQSSLQTLLAQAIAPILSSGGMTPQLQASETASANQINQNYSTLGDRMNSYLASRGFGQSGTAGQTALTNEIARQGDLAQNSANYGQQALNLFTTGLGDALSFSFANPGSSTTNSYTQQQNSQTFGGSSGSQWGVGLGIGATPGI